MGSPVPILLLITSYLLFVLRVGPWWMKNRPPYNVEKPMMLYNMVQMAINSYFVFMVRQTIKANSWHGIYSFLYTGYVKFYNIVFPFTYQFK